MKGLVYSFIAAVICGGILFVAMNASMEQGHKEVYISESKLETKALSQSVETIDAMRHAEPHPTESQFISTSMSVSESSSTSSSASSSVSSSEDFVN